MGELCEIKQRLVRRARAADLGNQRGPEGAEHFEPLGAGWREYFAVAHGKEILIGFGRVRKPHLSQFSRDPSFVVEMVPNRTGGAAGLDFLLCSVEQPIEDRTHGVGVVAMIAPKKFALAPFAFAPITQAARIRLLFVFAFWDRVGVGFLNDLHLVLCLAQETVSRGKFVALFCRNKIVSRQFQQRWQRARSAQFWLVAAVYQLQRLGEELDLTDTA